MINQQKRNRRRPQIYLKKKTCQPIKLEKENEQKQNDRQH
jgi:hypothetical protein